MDGWNLLVDLPDDIFTRVTRSLKAPDVCNLSLCCRTIYALAESEKVWLSQCDALGVIPPQDLIHWRNGVSSYKALCHFLFSVRPLFGIWVRQNPELGNVVYVMPAFLSIVACRIIPQEVRPLGLEHGQLLWAPVFEILPKFDGSPAFFLHGRDKDIDYLYPGSLSPVHKCCNVLLLEVQPIPNNPPPLVSFTQLPFSVRRKLLNIVTAQLRFNLPHSANDLVFPPLEGCCHHETFRVLDERRSLLMRMSDAPAPALAKLELCQMDNGQLHEFLQSGDKIVLALNASTIDLSYYEAWPIMHANMFALYKLPTPEYATTGHEYAGLWGGTFGWTLGEPAEDKALFFLSLSYQEDSHGQQLLFATKILEGNRYANRPNGSVMFTVDIKKPSLDPFPWETDGLADVKHAFLGEGIADGYGFRYPGSEPGSLYVIQDELLAFIWTESRDVLTMQRINLQQLLIKGQRVNALPPAANYAYLTRSYFNVFAATPSSPRFDDEDEDEDEDEDC